MEQIKHDMLSDRLCAACGVDISHKRKDAKCCSSACQKRAWAANNPDKQKACVAAWREANPERHRANYANWVARNPEKKVAMGREWRKSNSERTAALRRKWVAANPEKAAAGKKQWADANPDKVRAIQDRWRALNPERAKAHACASSHRRRAHKRQATGLQPVTSDQLSQRLDLFDGCCSYCGKAGKMTADHFIPLAGGGTHAPSNLVPACRSCNCSKNASDPEAWFRAQPFFTEKRWQQILKAVGKQGMHHGQLSLV